MAAQDYEQLSYNGPAGSQWGKSASEKTAMHGATPTIQGSAVTTLSINALSVSGVIGFTSSASFSVAITAINTILQVLRDKGVIAS